MLSILWARRAEQRGRVAGSCRSRYSQTRSKGATCVLATLNQPDPPPTAAPVPVQPLVHGAAFNIGSANLSRREIADAHGDRLEYIDQAVKIGHVRCRTLSSSSCLNPR